MHLYTEVHRKNGRGRLGIRISRPFSTEMLQFLLKPSPCRLPKPPQPKLGNLRNLRNRNPGNLRNLRNLRELRLLKPYRDQTGKTSSRALLQKPEMRPSNRHPRSPATICTAALRHTIVEHTDPKT